MATAQKQQQGRREEVYLFSAILPDGTEKVHRITSERQEHATCFAKQKAKQYDALSAVLWNGDTFLGEFADCIEMRAVATVEGATVFAR